MQGSGKTTLTTYLEALFKNDGLNCASLSIDDFYLTGQEQDNIAITNVGNKLLQYRGNGKHNRPFTVIVKPPANDICDLTAGTHDIKLLEETVAELMAATASSPTVLVPRYDKSLRNGRGDRSSEDKWTPMKGFY